MAVHGCVEIGVWVQITSVERLTYEASGDQVEFAFRGEGLDLLLGVGVLPGCIEVFTRALEEARAIAGE